MKLAIDVAYKEDVAFIAGVLFKEWSDEVPESVVYTVLEGIPEYEPGNFSKTELPCILYLIEQYDLKPECIVVDAAVFLTKEKKPGMGYHLYENLNKEIPVIGVAKSKFLDHDPKTEVFRRGAKSPIMVTSIGIEQEKAHEIVHEMGGRFKMPELLKRVDAECRELSNCKYKR